MAGALPGIPVTTRSTQAAALPDEAAKARKARFERLVREHYDFVWRSARRLGVPPADLDDVVQEVFFTAAQKLDTIHQERGYLFRKCFFVAANARRTVRRRREVNDDELLGAELDDAATPEEIVQTNEAREQLQAILDEMPKDLRAIFMLFELEHFTMAEIAHAVNISPGTVASRLRRARETFVAIMARAAARNGARR